MARILIAALCALATFACAMAASPTLVATVKIIGPSGLVTQAAGCRFTAPITLGPVGTAAAPVLIIEADCRLDRIFANGME